MSIHQQDHVHHAANASPQARLLRWPLRLLRRMFWAPLPRHESALALGLVLAFVLLYVVGFIPAQLAEVFAIVTGLASVWLALREHPLTWVATLVNTVAFAVIFWGAQAYANFALQCLQFGICLYGWLYWIGGKNGVGLEPPVSRATPHEWAWLIALGGLIAASLLMAAQGPMSWMVALDVGAAVVGVAALVLQARKRIECFVLWIFMLLLVGPIFYASGSMVMVWFVPVAVVAALIGLRGWARMLSSTR
jgi:nicotinamide mononucleotide transporter